MTDTSGWQFWIDQGGTFTDLIGRSPQGQLHSLKVLSRDQELSAARDGSKLTGIGAIERGIGLMTQAGHRLPPAEIASVQIGTTLGTNALLEGDTAATALLITEGFADALAIGTQQRPELFALHIRKSAPLYRQVLEIPERLDATGKVLIPLQPQRVEAGLRALLAQGIESVAICLLHSWRNSAHEEALAELAAAVGFSHIAVSHRILPQIRLIGRGGTALADAALAPVIERAFRPLTAQLTAAKVPLRFMQSNGHLVQAAQFRGCDSVLSGPAGGVNGGIAIAKHHGLAQVTGFDMGGTSTDVWHWAGSMERRRQVEIAGCRILTPTLDVHTIAAGGGSVLTRTTGRLLVGPHSAGAHPGPACYGRGGPPTVTDANFCAGYLHRAFFPAVFGPQADQPPDAEAAQRALASLADDRGQLAAVADAFLSVACNQMAAAIRRISMDRGYDPADTVLLCLGGAAGQHACRVAEQLQMKRILAHPLAGVLSALGIAVAGQGGVRRRTVQVRLEHKDAADTLHRLAAQLRSELRQSLFAREDAAPALEFSARVALLYQGSDSPLELQLQPQCSADMLRRQFDGEHLRRYGYSQPNQPVTAESVVVEIRTAGELELSEIQPAVSEPVGRLPDSVRMLVKGAMAQVPVLSVDKLGTDIWREPALIVHRQFSLNVRPGWQAQALGDGSVLLEQRQSVSYSERRGVSGSERRGARGSAAAGSAEFQVRQELFIGLFRNLAEKMGVAIRKTAASVNIRERLDYSCALFNAGGELIANAPHIPVHIGSMSDSVRALIAEMAQRGQPFAAGEFYASNDPYHGGTHLPDITVIAPFVLDGRAEFFLAVRGHHAEIGGVEPGSMPADSSRLEQEGVLLHNLLIAQGGEFLPAPVRRILTQGRWPSRDPELNLRDLQAQIAACNTGAEELRALVRRYGLAQVSQWAVRVLETGEAAVLSLLDRLDCGSATGRAGDGSLLQVRIEPDAAQGRLVVDFSGSAPLSAGNFNAPRSVTSACVLYVLRCLVQRDIPLNEGCMRPVELIIPPDCILAARPPAAVAGGNVETSQTVTALLLQALGVQAGSQGTMNNVTFGNDDFQYYETLGGGTGAGSDYPGADAVHSHMTNSQLTDPEILESRFPVLLEQLAIRRGSGGRGRQAGGCGMTRQLRFLADVSCSLITSGRDRGGRGIDGGQDGAAGRNLHLDAQGRQRELPACTRLSLRSGEALRLETPGGGGCGNVDNSPPTVQK